MHFYPRPPRGGRRHPRGKEPVGKLFLSTPSARRATRRFRRDALHLGISIHALREEGDWGTLSKVYDRCPISIHALREEGDSLSTAWPSDLSDFYPRPPRGGRPHVMTSLGSSSNFYPRPPRGGRLFRSGSCRRLCPFLSTPSARRATRPEWRQGQGLQISIHALREEGDRQVCVQRLRMD